MAEKDLRVKKSIILDGVGAGFLNISSAGSAVANIASTGSGNVVLATSPTLVTPVLGAATATTINGLTITSTTGGTITISNSKTLTVSNTLTLTGTDASSVAFGAGGTVAYQGGTLAQFAATTSSALAGVISDETGSGSLVFANTPTLVTPVLGVATATSINKVAITAPATSATLTIADGKTLTASNTLTFTGTDTSSVAFGTGGTVAYQGGTLAQFAATTSSALAGVISDETGSGALVFGTSPAITTSLTTPSTTFALINTTATTVNFAGAATSLNMGAAGGTTTVGGALVVTGDLTVNGTTTTVNSTVVTVDDILIELGSVGTPTDTTANGGGISLKGTTDKTILWDSTNSNWTSSENWNIASGKVFKINNVQVLSNTTLGSTVVSSSLTSVGTIGSGTWQGTQIGAAYGGTGQTTYAVGDLLYASASTTLSKLSAVATGNVLISGGVTTAPSWGKVGLTTHVSGTLDITNGGTNATTANAAFNNLAPSQTGNSGKYLTTDGSNTSWGTVSIAGSALTGTSLASGITSSSLQSFGVVSAINLGASPNTYATIDGKTYTLSVNTQTAVDTVAISTFRAIEYTIVLIQGSKTRMSKLAVTTNGTLVDCSEYAIVETGTAISGVDVTAAVNTTNSELRVTVTDAATTNVTIRIFRKVLAS